MEHGFDPLLPFHITPFLAVPWHIALLLDVLWLGGNEALQPTTGTKVSFHGVKCCQLVTTRGLSSQGMSGARMSALGPGWGSGAQTTHGCDS